MFPNWFADSMISTSSNWTCKLANTISIFLLELNWITWLIYPDLFISTKLLFGIALGMVKDPSCRENNSKLRSVKKIVALLMPLPSASNTNPLFCAKTQ